MQDTDPQFSQDPVNIPLKKNPFHEISSALEENYKKENKL